MICPYNGIDYGNDCADSVCFDCGIYDEWQSRMKRERTFLWHIFSDEKPVVTDDYIVLIAHAEKPTVLTWRSDLERFVDDVDIDNHYKVLYWGAFPIPPLEI